MSGLSNLWRPRNAPAVVVRPVGPGEIAVALSLLLGNVEQLAAPGHVADFEEIARLRGIDLTAIRLATLDGRLAAAALPVASPGKTVLLLLSPAGRSATAAELVARCATAVVDAMPKDDGSLIQILLDPSETTAAKALQSAKFAPLATLIYLNRRLAKGKFAEPDFADVRLLNYSPGTHARFARAILASYEESLDCPPMRGLRDIEDVIAGHRGRAILSPTTGSASSTPPVRNSACCCWRPSPPSR
ncbi:MAG: hypothetical protein QM754_12490 [Tepidisphaeraceae bacterium]